MSHLCQCNSSFNTTEHVSSNALQQRKITSFSMDIPLNRVGQGAPSGPAASHRDCFWDQTKRETQLAPMGLLLAGHVQLAC